jgi:acyl-coenzyme A thioesterase PaaI-like protein
LVHGHADQGWQDGVLREADVRTGDGRLVAHGTSTLMRLPGLGMQLGIPLWAE